MQTSIWELEWEHEPALVTAVTLSAHGRKRKFERMSVINQNQDSLVLFIDIV